MAVALRNAKLLPSLIFRKNARMNAYGPNERFVMTGRARLEKVLEDLQRNPYFEKYADKIAKFQRTSPEEFVQRVENQEKRLRQKKVVVHRSKFLPPRSLWTPSFLMRHSETSRTHVYQRNHFSNDASQNVYVTTPIFYVNAVPHIGHLYTALLADTITRYNAMKGHSVFLSTGTDEHGTKIEEAAGAANVPTHHFCSTMSRQFQEMCDTFHVNYSEFVRTTEKRHEAAVRHFWDCLEKRGHIYMGKYAGWYCVSDEAFIPDVELKYKVDARGNTATVSAQSENPVEWTEEKTYKFRLSSFRNDLRYWLKEEGVIEPAVYQKSLSSWLEEGLEDLSISRPTSRVPWAISTPSDKSQTIYVWFDALVNYLTAVGYPNSSYKKFWPPTVQVIGKDILKFHGIYWPAFLMAAGLEPPRKLVCHGHWMVNDEKMSKSKGNVVSPLYAVKHYTENGFRYFLLRQAVLHSNANYNETKVLRIVNAELANTFGNLCNRCLSKRLNPSRKIYNLTDYTDVLKSDIDLKCLEALEALSETAKFSYENYHLHHVVDAVMNVLHLANQMFEWHTPWKLNKYADADTERELNAVIALTLEIIRVAALVLYPIVPKLSSDILELLQVSYERRGWEDAKPLHVRNTVNGARFAAEMDKQIFKRLK